jgi:opacity protein-like surface antigen
MMPQKFGVANCVAEREPMVKGFIMRLARSVLSVMTALVCTGLAAPAALAADLSTHPTLDEDSFLPEEIGTGWYLRGDVGYSFNEAGSLSSHRGVNFSGLDAKDGFVGSIGFGYQFTDMVRADLTIDKLNSFDLTGTGSCSAWSSCTGGATSERTTLSAIAVMANVYADLGSWHGLTPYVGAGIGAAYVDVSGHSSTNGTSSRALSGYETWALAANVAAGASYTISEGLMFDLGYRFLWIDNAESGRSAAEGPVQAKDLTAHQIRAGLRYYLF